MDPAALWFGLEAVLLCLLVAFGSFGCGVGILFPLLGGEKEKREALEIARPFAPLQAVLFPAVVAGLLAGCPSGYRALLESLPGPALGFLLGMILRTAAVEVRARRNRSWSRAGWSAVVFTGSLLVMFSVGYVAANLLTGFPLASGGPADPSNRWSLSPLSVVGGGLLATYAAFQGILFLSTRAEGSLLKTMRRDMPVLAVNLVVFAAAACVLTAVRVPSSRPWTTGHPLHWIFAGLAVVALTLLVITVLRKAWMEAFCLSSLLSTFVILSLAAAGYPTVIPSRTDAAAVLATADAAAAGLPAALSLLAAAVPAVAVCLLFLTAWKGRAPVIRP